MTVGDGLVTVLKRFGLGAVLDRHEVRNVIAHAVEAVCHACAADVSLAPFLRASELSLLRGLSAPDEATSLQAWTRLVDEEPWLCATCRLLLP